MNAGTGRRRDLAIILAVNAWAHLRHPLLLLAGGRRCHSPMNVALPRSANEKFLWRKLFDHDPRFVTACDKLAAKSFIAARCPDLPAPRVLWEGTEPRAIPDAVLRGDVVVKANHGAGFNMFIRNGAYDRARVVHEADRWTRASFGRGRLEWAYHAVRPRLFVEELVLDANGLLASDVKLMMFAGKCLLTVVIHDRFGAGHAAVYDRHLQQLPVDAGIGVPISNAPLPSRIGEMIEAAERISSGFDHLRCDFLVSGDRFFAGELTVYNLGGRMDYRGCERESEFAEAWDIRGTWFLQARHSGWRKRYAAALLRLLEDARLSDS